ncbi:cytochrome c biogenesis heme-transporting ATPase CcmA [Vibrio algivorus]|uniref:Cytochrome c biogenesis ATP-binding export protein CcmA n=1 Tax=Vibrio algivorus TaxID=1667024 RepID=A0A557PAZ4_9VIBR|nr:cytochrome c biogenesis heme-transporting ATPase CcmA [Vibrio algivorus]TVO37826.1 cytochrome c biogenesis heme-transporting ATPase CcmA [Vibrio algivorus]GLT16208.1 cytochrome c biogenesis ATP-binding export protein CcmA [Vibrio algivorus]
MLEVRDLTAIRDDRELFESISFSVSAGDLVQVEGRNGSGKTTMLRIITGLGDSEAGRIIWKGVETRKDRDAFHQDLLFIGHQTGVKKELTAFENLSFYQKLNGSTDVTEDDIWMALAKVGLAGKEDIPAGKLSAGQQRRVALARLWLSRHPLWILDEPLTAIDKQGIKVIEALFMEHTQKGGMVLFTTHQDMFAEMDQLKTIRLGE